MLESGGDCCYRNSNASQGTFEEAVQANIVAAKYGSAAAMVTSYDTSTDVDTR
jgi:hypothetical protein